VKTFFAVALPGFKGVLGRVEKLPGFENAAATPTSMNSAFRRHRSLEWRVLGAEQKQETRRERSKTRNVDSVVPACLADVRRKNTGSVL